MLKDHGNPVGRAGADRLAVDEKPAATEIGEARDATQKRGLAAARGAHDAHDLVALDRKRQLMEGDDGAIEKELAGDVGDNGWINDCFPGNHAFLVHGGVAHGAAAAASSLGKKSAERNASSARPRLHMRAVSAGLMAWRRAAGAPGSTVVADRE